MRFVNASGRSALLESDVVHDLHECSGGRLDADPMRLLATQWDELERLRPQLDVSAGTPVEEVELGPPVPTPGAVFGIGLNYRGHAAEVGMPVPEAPVVFAKFPSSVGGPHDPIVIPAGDVQVDWEGELAFAIGRRGRRISRERAMEHVAGVMVAQDISERELQLALGGQFCLGKSFDSFCPIGPALVTLDELRPIEELRLECRVNGEPMQASPLSDLIFDIPHLVEYLSSVCTLRPGDVCLTGTPAGVGFSRSPPMFLKPGDTLVTSISGLGDLRNECVAEPARAGDGEAPVTQSVQ